jgi:hypothetical protein
VITDSQGLGTITNDDSGNSMIALNSSIPGALSLSGNATVTVAGPVVVNSTSSQALSATGNSRLTASVVNVAGGSKITGNSVVSPSPTPGSIADPLAGTPAPCPGASPTVVKVTGGSQSIAPGTYASIEVAGSGSLTMASGVYIIAGGGFKVSGKGNVTGTDVVIVNTTSLGGPGCSGSGGTMGAFNVSGNGNISLTPLSSGPLGGLLVYQPAANTSRMSISGNATLGMSGTIYAPKAQVNVTGNGSLTETIIADQIRLSGNAGSSLVSVGTVSESIEGAINAGQLMTGLVWVSVDGSVSAIEKSRISDAIVTLNDTFGPYGVSLVLVDATTPGEDIRIHDSNTTPVGGKADGVLGYADHSGDIYIVNDWTWYTATDATAIGATQYDYQTVITHELGHGIGLDHSTDSASVMHASLDSGVAHRGFTAFDLSNLGAGGESTSDTDRELRAGGHGEILYAGRAAGKQLAPTHVRDVVLAGATGYGSSLTLDLASLSDGRRFSSDGRDQVFAELAHHEDKPVRTLQQTTTRRVAKLASLQRHREDSASDPEAVGSLFARCDQMSLDDWLKPGKKARTNLAEDAAISTRLRADL